MRSLEAARSQDATRSLGAARTLAAAAGLSASLLLAAAAARAACTQQMATTARVVAANDAAGLGQSVLAIGTPTRLALAPIAALHFPARPARTSGPYAGLVSFDVKQAGAFRIALGARASLDVMEGGGLVDAVAHRHGAACSGIAKAVIFPLVAGRHVVEITASAAPVVAILVTPTD